MARVDKIIQKMINQPKGILYEEGKKVLEDYGYLLVRTKGSHHHFRNDKGNLITIKYSNPLKAAYVKDILARIGK